MSMPATRRVRRGRWSGVGLNSRSRLTRPLHVGAARPLAATAGGPAGRRQTTRSKRRRRPFHSPRRGREAHRPRRRRPPARTPEALENSAQRPRPPRRPPPRWRAAPSTCALRPGGRRDAREDRARGRQRRRRRQAGRRRAAGRRRPARWPRGRRTPRFRPAPGSGRSHAAEPVEQQGPAVVYTVKMPAPVSLPSHHGEANAYTARIQADRPGRLHHPASSIRPGAQSLLRSSRAGRSADVSASSPAASPGVAVNVAASTVGLRDQEPVERILAQRRQLAHGPRDRRDPTAAEQQTPAPQHPRGEDERMRRGLLHRHFPDAGRQARRCLRAAINGGPLQSPSRARAPTRPEGACRAAKSAAASNPRRLRTLR